MKLLITGSRTITNYKFVFDILDEFRVYFHIDEMIFGDASGVDFLCKLYCIYHKIEYDENKAEWNKYGRSAGIIRNNEMIRKLSLDDKGIGIWDGKSKGTKHCIDELRKQNKLLKIYIEGVENYHPLSKK